MNAKDNSFQKSFKRSLFNDTIEEVDRKKELTTNNQQEITRKLERFLDLFESACQKQVNKLPPIGETSFDKHQFILTEKKTLKKFTYDIQVDKERDCAILKVMNQHYRMLPWTLEEINAKKIMNDGLILVVKKAYETHLSV